MQYAEEWRYRLTRLKAARKIQRQFRYFRSRRWLARTLDSSFDRSYPRAFSLSVSLPPPLAVMSPLSLLISVPDTFIPFRRMAAQKKVLARLKKFHMDNSLGGNILVLMGVPRRYFTHFVTFLVFFLHMLIPAFARVTIPLLSLQSHSSPRKVLFCSCDGPAAVEAVPRAASPNCGGQCIYLSLFCC